MDYLFLIVGLGLLLLSADYLVDSSVAIAQRAKISNFIIGLTIVGMGTSAPELFVGVKSALAGDGDIAMGNVIGSNIANVLLILGVAGMILPFDIERTTIRRDIPFGIGAAALLFLVANDKLIPGIQENPISRVDAVFFLVLFVCYMGYVVVQKGKDPQKALSEADEETKSKLAGKHPALLWFIALVSLVGLIGGGNLFLDAAKKLATDWGMSEAVISITIVAVGTSLPELITAVVAACKNNPQLALGNVIGSNVFNILFILGVSGCVKPLNVVGVHLLDYAMMLGAAVLTAVVAFTFKRDKFDRIEGFIFLTLYITYTVFLFIR